MGAARVIRPAPLSAAAIRPPPANRIDRRSVFARARVQGAIGWDVLWLCDPEEPATLGLLAANIQSKRRSNEESGNGQRTAPSHGPDAWETVRARVMLV